MAPYAKLRGAFRAWGPDLGRADEHRSGRKQPNLPLKLWVGLMAYDVSKVRWRLMNYARDLARSGAHEDHRTILSQLQADPEFDRVRRWLEDRPFRAQLDQLCNRVLRQSA